MARANLFSIATALSALVAMAIADGTRAQARVEVGQLICKGDGGIGLIIVSKKSFNCSFMPAGGAPTQQYMATITNFGVDIGQTADTVLVWTVLASNDRVGAGMLSGSFVGASANASVGVGGGASLLIGGSSNSISLQPLSGQVQVGLNVAAGVNSLELSAR
jgi:Protein of unknown function (DUF992)